MLTRIDIATNGGTIVDEPKISTTMTIIEFDNGSGEVTYSGNAGVEYRGSSSQLLYPKKSLGIETWDADGGDLEVSLLGFPEEEDWVLYAPYSDKTMMRNTLMYSLYTEMGHYASRWEYVDLYVNNSYQGVYVFMEKLKRDKNRIDINKLKDDEISGEDVTGGYILKLDKSLNGSLDNLGPWGFPDFAYYTEHNSFQSQQGAMQGGSGHYFLYEYPDADDIVAEQRAYIQQAVHNFEAALAGSNFTDPTQGYRAHIDVDSFIDFFLFTELSGDVDAFNMSTYIQKEKNEKIAMGPVWDFNIALGNANYCDGQRTDVWRYNGCEQAVMTGFPMPFWWERLLQDSSFNAQVKARWQQLRSSTLSNQHVMARIDEIRQILVNANAIQRNETVWPVIGQQLWPNYFVGMTYDEEITFMKSWLQDRLSWLDTNLYNLP